METERMRAALAAFISAADAEHELLKKSFNHLSKEAPTRVNVSKTTQQYRDARFKLMESREGEPALASSEGPCECDSSKGILCDKHNPIMQSAEKSLMRPTFEEPLRKLTREEFEAEARLHKADWRYGSPLDMGNGFSIAVHAADCPRCSFLARWVALANPAAAPPPTASFRTRVVQLQAALCKIQDIASGVIYSTSESDAINQCNAVADDALANPVAAAPAAEKLAGEQK